MAEHSFKIGDFLGLTLGDRATKVMVVGFIHDGILSEKASPFLSCLIFTTPWQQVVLHYSLLRPQGPGSEYSVQ